MNKRCAIVLILLLVWSQAVVAAPPTRQQITRLGRQLDPLINCMNDTTKSFGINIKIEGDFAGQISLAHFDDQSWRLYIDHADYPVDLNRTADRTELYLPKHNILFVGQGDIAGDDHLEAAGAQARLVSHATLALPIVTTLAYSTGQSAALMLVTIASLQADPQQPNTWQTSKLANTSLTFDDQDTITISLPQGSASINIVDPTGLPFLKRPKNVTIKTLDRTEMERLIARGIRRATEILAPGPSLTNPKLQPKFVDHGELNWQNGQRLILLSGTPEQIGKAHAELLSDEMRRLGDSVLYVVGLANTIRTGRWALDDLRDAWKRLEPHIPADHKAEMAAMAKAGPFTLEETQLANVFPELFHCSGFAVFGKATLGGKLYHGRVLDYMTRIGLQESAGLFVVAVDGKIPFATVGYAGFIGSVTGMNNKQISIGEMGGGGEGQWDGVPMAMLGSVGKPHFVATRRYR